MFAITIIEGERRAGRAAGGARTLRAALAVARRAGFAVGRRVRLGSITGRIIGYNISGDEGLYPGVLFPLLVATVYGVAKCSLDEIRLLKTSP